MGCLAAMLPSYENPWLFWLELVGRFGATCLFLLLTFFVLILSLLVGFARGGHLRLAYCVDDHTIEEALPRFAAAREDVDATRIIHVEVVVGTRIVFPNSPRVAIEPLDRAEVHAAVYRVVYGGRSAIEEALAQTGSEVLPALVHLEG